jgi:hypothetical protein
MFCKWGTIPGMQKVKLSVETPLGTFTRTTARTYAFVVASRGKDAAHLAREARSQKAAAEQNIAYYESGRSSYTPEQRAGYIAGEQKRIARWSDPAHLAQEAQAVTEWGWASRLDLAEKVAAKARSYGYTDVQIFEVNP